jgi:hypothetical protein
MQDDHRELLGILDGSTPLDDPVDLKALARATDEKGQVK